MWGEMEQFDHEAGLAAHSRPASCLHTCSCSRSYATCPNRDNGSATVSPSISACYMCRPLSALPIAEPAYRVNADVCIYVLQSR